MKKVLVIIPNYNKVNLLSNCLDFLNKDNTYSFDILVIDNGSTDGSVNFLLENKKQQNNLHYILLSNNEGFAKAVNKGFKYSIDNKYDYSILLNNDTEVKKEFVKNLVSFIEKKKNCFSVSSLMIDYKNRDICDDCGDGYCVLGYQFQINKDYEINSIKNNFKVFSSCGGASIFDNKKLQVTGLLDEFHFAYLEDIDLGFRGKLFGYDNYFTKSAACYHIGSATTGSKYNELKVKLSSRNNILLLYKNMPNLMIIINFPFLLIGFLLKWIFFIKIGFGNEYIFGLHEGLHSLSYVKRVNFKQISLFRFILIECDLIKFTFIYTLQFLKRQKNKYENR